MALIIDVGGKNTCAVVGKRIIIVVDCTLDSCFTLIVIASSSNTLKPDYETAADSTVAS